MPIVASSSKGNKSVLPLPVPAVLVQPEEQTDNWDDDFEEGISFSKLQGTSHSPRSSTFYPVPFPSY